MKPHPKKSVYSTARPLLAGLASVCLVLAACGKAPQAGGKPADGGTDKQAGAQSQTEAVEKGQEGVTLTEEQIGKLGVTTQPAQAIEYREETAGYGVVLEHQVIAQAVADLQTAQATARFSKASLERAHQLQGTPGAVSTDLEQTAEQKAAVDSVALTLTTEKLSSIWGMKPPWKGDIGDSRVQSLAHGAVQLVRVTFPLGTVTAVPEQLHGGRVGTDRPEAPASLRPVWAAPADTNIPGRSFFTLLPAGTLAEGERLQVWAPTGQPTSGVVIPTTAIIMSSGKYWCYVENTVGTFVRAEVDTSRPTSGGYVVTEGVKPGDKIAITGVGLLLAKETGSSEEPD